MRHQYPLLAISALSLVAPSTARAGPLMLIISFDGLRPDAIEASRTPNLAALIAAGSYQPTCLNELPPITLPNHASMVTGLSTARHGVLVNVDVPGHVAWPTLFDVATAAGRRVGFFVSKSKLSYLCRPESAVRRVILDDQDALTSAIVESLAADDLDLAFIHFADPDRTGHDTGWMSEPYLGAVADSDARLGRVLDALTDTGLRDETTILITADHGGWGETHILNIPSVRHVPFLLVGPEIAAGRLLCEQRRVVDVAAVVIGVLGLDMPNIDGRPADEALVSFAQPPCEPAPPLLGNPCGILPFGGLLAFAVSLSLWYGRGKKSDDAAAPGAS